ncbi:MAG TPA: hypothetical protein VFJ85_08260 [Acidimicrobiales bacterium]|nr:hypothetical protein [Acidimicrobiales bacterium]
MRRRLAATPVLLLAVAGLTAAAPAASAAGPPTTDLVSRAAGAGPAASGASTAPSISADGRYVAFESAAANLSPDDPDAVSDVYVRDRRSGAVTLVSRATGASGAKGNGASRAPSISADGKVVAFASAATNLDPADTDATTDVYVRDLVAGTTVLVSRATGPAGAKADNVANAPSIDGDGGRVAFSTIAANLDPADADGQVDVYVRDVAAATTTLASRASGAAGAKGNGLSTAGAISADGSRVAFVSAANNLDAGDADLALDVYVRDLAATTTTLVSRATGVSGAKGNGSSSGAPQLSADGRVVVFDSIATNLDPDDSDSLRDVYARDLDGAATTLVSRATGASGAKGNGASNRADVSADGTQVSFTSAATDLDPADADTTLDVYVRDLATATTTLASRASGAAGAKGNAASGTTASSLGGDGRYVAFDSLASDLDPADGTSASDVYVRTLATPEVAAVDVPALRPGARRTVGVTGSGFTATPDVSFGPGVVVGAVRFVSSTRLEVSVVVPFGSAAGARTVTVTNPAGDAATGVGPTVTEAPGYWLVARDGGIFSFDAAFAGSTGNIRLNQPIVGMAADPDGSGYWFVAADGGVFAFDAGFYGSMGGTHLNQPVVGMAAAPDGAGYWLVARDGGIFAFGSARFAGSTGDMHLNQPIVGMAADPDGSGYWFVAADGGVFAFDALYPGSMGGTPLNQPVVGMAAATDGKGYWLVARDGGIFSFGSANFAGSTGNVRLNQPIVGMAADPDGSGYWFVAADGGVFAFDAVYHGSMGATPLNQPVVGMAAA